MFKKVKLIIVLVIALLFGITGSASAGNIVDMGQPLPTGTVPTCATCGLDGSIWVAGGTVVYQYTGGSWVSRGTPAGITSTITGITANIDGSIWVVSNSGNTSRYYEDAWTSKDLCLSYFCEIYPYNMACDSNGNVYVFGRYVSSGTGYGYGFVSKYTTSWQIYWNSYHNYLGTGAIGPDNSVQYGYSTSGSCSDTFYYLKNTSIWSSYTMYFPASTIDGSVTGLSVGSNGVVSAFNVDGYAINDYKGCSYFYRYTTGWSGITVDSSGNGRTSGTVPTPDGKVWYTNASNYPTYYNGSANTVGSTAVGRILAQDSAGSVWYIPNASGGHAYKYNGVITLSASSVSQSSVTLNYGFDGNSISFPLTLQRSTDNVNWTNLCTVTGTNYNVNGLTPGTRYYFRLAHKDPVSNVLIPSSSISILTIPANPSSVTLTVNSSNQNTVTWPAVTGASSYNIYRNGSPLVSGLTAASYTDTGLSPNTSYYYTVYVINSTGSSGGTSSSTLYTFAQIPSITLSNPSSSTLEADVTDSNPPGTLYQVVTGSNYVTQNGALTTTTTWITINSKKVTVTGLSPNTAYTFTAYAKNGSGNVTVASAPVTGTTLVAPPAIPTNLTYTATASSITVSWPAVTGAVTYSINIDNGAIIVNNYPSTSYVHTGLASGVQHTYSVKAVNAGGSSNWSTPLAAATLLATPANITATSTGTSITLNWSPVANATGYDVKVDGIITSTSNTSITIGGLDANTQHTYDIRATNSVSTSNWSSQQNKSTRLNAPGIPVNLNSTSTNSSITITWSPVPDATTYQVSADGNIINSGSGTSYTDTGLTPGTEHTYMVRAVNSGGKSAWSSPVTASTIPLDPNVPANLTATVTNNDITVTWDLVENATSYHLEIGELTITDSVYGQTVTETVYNITVSGTVYSQTGITLGSVYIYRVRSEIGGVISDWSPSITATPGATPTGIPQNITATPGDTSVSLIWDSVSGASGYDIEENGTVIGSVRAVTYTHGGLTPDTQYTYRIRAVNTAGAGEWSAPVTATTLASPPLAVPGNIMAMPTTNSISLLWDPVDGATGYDIEIDQTISQTVTQNVYTLTGLSPDTQHTFRVRAVNGSTQGAWSGVLTATTLTDQPTTPPPGATSASYTASVLQDEEFILVFTASDIQNLSNSSFTVTYNPDQLDVEDLYATTSQTDTAVGNIPGTDLSVTQFTPGTAILTLNTPVSPGQSFTGLVTTIRFRSKINGNSVITFSVD